MQLIVSELVTNSVTALEETARHMAPQVPAVRFRLSADPGPDGAMVTVEVWDQLPSPPRPRSPVATEEGGRGLLLVGAVAKEWGWYWPDHRVGPGVEWRPAEPKLITESTALFGKVTWATVTNGHGRGGPLPTPG
ncbi:hypothetical protein DPM19_29285 [Actinomadura craniellae]|uniref:ATP-binding protein n=2 Tax=Actinomadura craniellae TaxID=2231787 RepID=A0A365GY01_9ACTN|nr:hypothetical protein DPM19_29285 [Actinomadura craniellae]